MCVCSGHALKGIFTPIALCTMLHHMDLSVERSDHVCGWHPRSVINSSFWGSVQCFMWLSAAFWGVKSQMHGTSPFLCDERPSPFRHCARYHSLARMPSFDAMRTTDIIHNCVVWQSGELKVPRGDVLLVRSCLGPDDASCGSAPPKSRPAVCRPTSFVRAW